MPERSCQVVVLAAGEGTRMKSSRSKVMHQLAGLPMLGHVMKAASVVKPHHISVVAAS